MRTERLPLRLHVVVIDPVTDEEIRDFTVTWSNPDRRAWFDKMQVWAWTNGYIVETSREEICVETLDSA